MKRLLWSRTRFGFLAAAIFVVCGVALNWRALLMEIRLSQTRSALESRDYERAARHLTAAERLAPDRPEVQMLLARTYRHLGQVEKVRRHLERAWRRGADVERLKSEQWLVLAQIGRLREAEPHLAGLLRNAGLEGSEVCEAYVHGYLLNYRLTEALQLIEAWQKDYPRDSEPHFLEAFAREAQFRQEDAVSAYRRGLEREPDRTRMRLRLATLLMELRRFDESEEEFRRCLREASSDPDLLTAWGRYLFTRGRTDEARNLLAKLLAKDPERFEALRLMGEVELSQGKFEDVVRWLQPAAERHPNDTTIRYTLAKALRALGRAEAAQPHFDYVAEAEAPLNRMEQQLQDVSVRPYDVQLRFEIGATMLKYAVPEDGVKWLRTVLEMDPGHREAHLALADYYEAGGDPRTGRDHRRRAESLGKSDPPPERSSVRQ